MLVLIAPLSAKIPCCTRAVVGMSLTTLISLITVEVGIIVKGSAKVAKSINVEVGINVEGGIFWKKLVHKCNKQGVGEE